MDHPLFSVPWIEHYQALWNENERAIEGTKGLGALVEFVVTDQDDRPPVHFNVTVEGIADYAGPQQDAEPFFRLTAPTETWRKVAKQEIGTKRAVTGPVKFHGSLLTALKYFDGLDAALKQIGDVPTTEWSSS